MYTYKQIFVKRDGMIESIVSQQLYNFQNRKVCIPHINLCQSLLRFKTYLHDYALFTFSQTYISSYFAKFILLYYY